MHVCIHAHTFSTHKIRTDLASCAGGDVTSNSSSLVTHLWRCLSVGGTQLILTVPWWRGDPCLGCACAYSSGRSSLGDVLSGVVNGLFMPSCRMLKDQIQVGRSRQLNSGLERQPSTQTLGQSCRDGDRWTWTTFRIFPAHLIQLSESFNSGRQLF